MCVTKKILHFKKMFKYYLCMHLFHTQIIIINVKVIDDDELLFSMHL